MLDGNIGPLDARNRKRHSLYFVERGGGLVCVGDAAETYHEYELLGQVLGNIHGTCSTRSEMIARVANPDHYITRRVDPSFAVLESVYMLAQSSASMPLFCGVPPGTILPTPWPMPTVSAQDVSSARRWAVHLLRPLIPLYQQMVARAIRYASGVETEEHPARVAMIGYGAIGFEHGTAISTCAGIGIRACL